MARYSLHNFRLLFTDVAIVVLWKNSRIDEHFFDSVTGIQTMGQHG